VKAAAHLKVVALAAEVMPAELAGLMSRLREGIERGATLPDEFRSYWDVDDGGGRFRVRMHRCYVDSSDVKDRGCPLQIVRYVQGIPGFFEEWAQGRLEDAYDEETFPLNAGAFLGVLSHHICDLWTAVHLGCSLPPVGPGYRSRAGLHSRVEADLDLAARSVTSIRPYVPRGQSFTTDALEAVARDVFDAFYLKLPMIYRPRRPPAARARSLVPCVEGAARLTADAWLATLRRVSPAALRHAAGTALAMGEIT
jgi:hypothetical protein